MTGMALYIATGFLAVIGGVVLFFAIYWHVNKSVDFDLRQTVIDSQTGKISVEKFGFMTSLTASTWALVTLTLDGRLTEWFFAGYMAAFAVARWASQYLAVKSQGTPNAGPTP